MTGEFIALNGDGEPRFYGLGDKGVGHIVLIRRGFQNDPLASGATFDKPCGGKALEGGRLGERFKGEGDALCKRCVAWLASLGGQNDLEAARMDKWRTEDAGESVASLIGDHVVIDLDGVREVKADGGDAREKTAPVTREIITPEVAREVVRDATRKQKRAARSDAVAAWQVRRTEQRTQRVQQRQREAVAAYYAAGHPVPAEVAGLPDPHVTSATWTGHTGALGESVPWCGFKGEPMEGSDADGVTGKCPECRGVIGLSDKGLIGKHRMYGVKMSSRTGLKSKSVDAVDHGSVPGSPRDADKRRGKEIGKGKANSASTPRFKGGADAGKGSREHGSVNGSANTGRANLPPIQPQKGWLAVAGTTALSMTVRPGVDAGVSGAFCPVCKDLVERAHRGKSRAWRRNHSRRVAAWHTAENARREVKREREIKQGERLPGKTRSAARKAASIGSAADGTQAATGLVVHAACARPEKTPAVKPRGMTR
ncbi:hypothetical protein [Streptomyces cucumeris]|uniref:hypothetical protein n=1 Tax=Streptomyces cucumeris TaxID=2962890 RepID=UPI0020C84856|nr:hypothetical protein [Streptomyces sp. NEAU-Y11]MCP9209540.1 hypothetical protein [Streptomyces sp. NEAU-Y11]